MISSPPLHGRDPTGGSHGDLHRTARIHRRARQRSGCVAARGARAAAGDAGDRIPGQRVTRRDRGLLFLSVGIFRILQMLPVPRSKL
jgi:hypothetical protein